MGFLRFCKQCVFSACVVSVEESCMSIINVDTWYWWMTVWTGSGWLHKWTSHWHAIHLNSIVFMVVWILMSFIIYCTPPFKKYVWFASIHTLLRSFISMMNPDAHEPIHNISIKHVKRIIYHGSMTPKSVMPTVKSCIDVKLKEYPADSAKETAKWEWCHVHFNCDSHSTFIRRVFWLGKNAMELFFSLKFYFSSTWTRYWATSNHKHPVCHSPARDTEITSVWSRCFGTNRIIDNWHWCIGVM